MWNFNFLTTAKWMAFFFMVMDHVGVMFLGTEDGFYLRMIGRVSFPIFGMLIVYSATYLTKDRIAFMKRLLIFGVISQPFSIFFSPSQENTLNIMFSLLSAVVMIYAFENSIKKANRILTITMAIIISSVSSYNLPGLAFMMLFYFYIKTKEKKYLFFSLLPLFLIEISSFPLIAGIISISTVIVFVLILGEGPININKKKNKSFLKKYLFYILYPLQFLLLKVYFLL